MRVVIIGGGGMLGQKLARALARRGQIGGRPVTAMTLADIADPDPVEAGFPVDTVQMDITGRAEVDGVLAGGANIIYHLAAVVSGQAEEEFDLGMAINLVGSINVFEAARAMGTCPKVIFASSIAVYGGEVPEMIEDWTALNPQTSYGAHKAAAEMALFGNEGDNAIGGIRKKLVEGGHHHHSDGEAKGVYEPGFVIIKRETKQKVLKTVAAYKQAKSEQEREKAWKQFAELAHAALSP